MRALSLALLALCLVITSACSSKFRSYSGPEVTSVLIFKAERKMYLLHGNKALKVYKIGLGGNPVGDKQFEGDMKTPEGAYLISHRNPNSAYHLSLGISYPNDEDRAEAAALGKKPGGDIFIHGRGDKAQKNGADWTAGCIAVTNREMEDIYAMVKPGTPIFIKP